jgi:hypothetical protein
MDPHYADLRTGGNLPDHGGAAHAIAITIAALCCVAVGFGLWWSL